MDIRNLPFVGFACDRIRQAPTAILHFLLDIVPKETSIVVVGFLGKLALVASLLKL